jgi:hypothetical protein
MTILPKGLAFAQNYPEDIATLGCAWYYDWQCNPAQLSDPGYVPMSRDGLMVSLPADYSGPLLVFNEPTGKEPFGYPITAADAAIRYRALRLAFPLAKFVVGGVSAWDCNVTGSGTWLKDFKRIIACLGCPKPYAYHVHGYVEDWIKVGHLKIWWTHQQSVVGGKLWISEYNDVSGNAANLHALTDWIKSRTWVERYACFTNRSGSEPWALGAGCNLVDEYGRLTESGEFYQTA